MPQQDAPHQQHGAGGVDRGELPGAPALAEAHLAAGRVQRHQPVAREEQRVPDPVEGGVQAVQARPEDRKLGISPDRVELFEAYEF